MSNIASYAESLIGLYTGRWDCSGFVSHCYAQCGRSCPSSSSAIWSSGTPASGAAGDIVCWSGHVGICDGAGNVIHSYNSNHNIRKDPISKVSQWDGRTVLGYRTF